MSYENLPWITVLWQDHFCCSTCAETIVFLGKKSKTFFHLSNQWSIMQYLNFGSKKIFFSVYGLLFLRGFWRLLINCLSSKRSNFLSLLRIFSLQLSLNSSLRLKILLFTFKISFLLFFQNLLFQKKLINSAEKESPQHVSLNI